MRAAGWSSRGWWTATPISPSADGAPTSSSSGSSAGAISRSPRRAAGIARTMRLTREASDAGAGRARRRLSARDAGARGDDGRMQERLRPRPRATSSGCSASTGRSRTRSRSGWSRPFSAPTSCRRNSATTARAISRSSSTSSSPTIAQRAAGRGSATSSSSARRSRVDEARRLLRGAAQAAGLGAKLHADQLSAGGGAELAAEVGAASADHLECASDAGIAAMARAGVVAVSLPLASLYLGQTADAGPAVDRGRRRRRRGDRLQSRLGAELPSAAGADAGLHAPADDAGGGAQGRHLDRRAGGRTRGADRLARGGQGGRLRGHRRAGRRTMAVPPSRQRLPGATRGGAARTAWTRRGFTLRVAEPRTSLCGSCRSVSVTAL